MPRSVGLLQTVAVSVGVTIGSGIFRVPATVAGQLHGAGSDPLVLGARGPGRTVRCAVVAELAGALPRSGGVFAYLLESYGPLPAFLFGWTELVVVRAAALGATVDDIRRVPRLFHAAHACSRCATSPPAAIAADRRDELHRRAARGAAVLSATTALKYVALLALGLAGVHGHAVAARAFHAALEPAAVACRSSPPR